MLYIKRVIDMLRSVLYDVAIKISSRPPSDKILSVYDICSEEQIEVFRRIANTLDCLEADFRLFLDYIKEHNDEQA